jgi:hypothetical protein
VIVDLRAAGIAASAVDGGANSSVGAPAADVRLVRIPIAQPDPPAALDLVLGALSAPAAAAEDPEALYSAERAALADFRIVPLAHASENWGLGAAVRDWMATRWGDLRLDDAWLDRSPTANSQ